MEANNMAAMREALENSNGLLEELAVIGEWGESAREQIAENNAALAAPPRNCDVGTADEQKQRYDEWCNHDILRVMFGLDELDWAQMPYEEGVAE